AGPNLEHMDLETSDTSIQPNLRKPILNRRFSQWSPFPIHQDTSSVPLMTTLVIDLTVSQHVPIAVQASLPTLTATVTATTTTTKTITLPPIPPQPQQGSSDSILIKHIENLDIPHKVSKSVDKIVTDAIDWAIQSPLRDRF
ncbi:hypothetical protein Tco_1579535, partial [Tanacetum coccineum]